ncbi:MAG: carbohydrate-binding family 9-like protein, partial [Ginsengibacter sp.]
CKVNFYKCGDKLPKPHFLTWNTVETEDPDFHAPEYFGSMEFS